MHSRDCKIRQCDALDCGGPLKQFLLFGANPCLNSRVLWRCHKRTLFFFDYCTANCRNMSRLLLDFLEGLQDANPIRAVCFQLVTDYEFPVTAAFWAE